MILFFISCLILGLIVGFLAGLFGIGGGLIIVPTLVYLFPMVGVPPEHLMSAALGTSFATIVITAFSSAQRHHKLGNVDLRVAKVLLPSIMISVFLCGLFISGLDAQLAKKLFAVMVVYMAGRMIFSLKKSGKIRPLTQKSMVIAGGVIGALSSIAGIGGGGFIVPFLNGRGVGMKTAIGTSSFCGAFLGLAGMFSFIASGWNVSDLPEFSLGYIYLPALVGITLTSFFTSKLGANAANSLPVPILKKGFACLLLVMAMKIFLS